MIQRFHIEDLLVQDRSGVVFRAVDTETGNTVAIRRFFPFGPDGGGLQGDEQTAYGEAVERLASISHPALRAVICGGCDPVDGMPYLATEWVEGPRLSAFVEHGPVSAEEATHLLGQALEVSELLSGVLAEEAVWIETGLNSIVVGAENSGRGITFWISPLKWLGKKVGQRGLESIITLAEEIVGYGGKPVADPAAKRLAEWMKWLRTAATTATLHEAREKLAAAGGLEPPVRAKKLVRQAKRAGPSSRKKRLVTGVWLSAMLAALGGGGWALIHWHNARLAAQASAPAFAAMDEETLTPPVPVESSLADAEPDFPSLPGESRENRASRMGIALTEKLQEGTATLRAKEIEQQARVAERGGVFLPSDHNLLVGQEKKEVTVEGVLEAIAFSSKGRKAKTMYLQFSKDSKGPEPVGAVTLKTAPTDLQEKQLAPLLGKKVRMKGEVKVETKATSTRPIIVIDKRSAIQEVK